MFELPPEAICRDWTLEQVEEFFQSCSLPEYAEAAREHCVDGHVFSELLRLNGLSDLGCKSKLHQARILARLRCLSSDSPLGHDHALRIAAADVAGGPADVLGALTCGVRKNDMSRSDLIMFLKDLVSALEKASDESHSLELLRHSTAATGDVHDTWRQALVASIMSGLSDCCTQFTPDTKADAIHSRSTGYHMQAELDHFEEAAARVLPTFEEFVRRSNSTGSDHKADVPTHSSSTVAGNNSGIDSSHFGQGDKDIREIGCSFSPRMSCHSVSNREICSQNGLRVTAGASFRRLPDDSGPETVVLWVDNVSSRNLAVRALTTSLLSYIVSPANYTLLPAETREIHITPVTRNRQPYALMLEVASVQGADVLLAEGWSKLQDSCIDRLNLQVASGSIEMLAPHRQPLAQPLTSSQSARVLSLRAPHRQVEQSAVTHLADSGLQPQHPSSTAFSSLHRSASGVSLESRRSKLSTPCIATSRRSFLGGGVDSPAGSRISPGVRSFIGSFGAPVASPSKQLRVHGGGSLTSPPGQSPDKQSGAAVPSGAASWTRQHGALRLSTRVRSPREGDSVSGRPLISAK